MDQFDHILTWTLKQGSHTFQGKEGGTCINELGYGGTRPSHHLAQTRLSSWVSRERSKDEAMTPDRLKGNL